MILLRRIVPSPLGDIFLLSNEEGALVWLDWTERPERRFTWLQRRFGIWDEQDSEVLAGAQQTLERYFSREFGALDELTVDTGGSETQRVIWKLLREIPAGKTESYGALAVRSGIEDGARAVGMINGMNPVSLVLPCHRVIGADGSLTGYAGGLDRKKSLLEMEGALHPPQLTLQLD